MVQKPVSGSLLRTMVSTGLPFPGHAYNVTALPLIFPFILITKPASVMVNLPPPVTGAPLGSTPEKVQFIGLGFLGVPAVAAAGAVMAAIASAVPMRIAFRLRCKVMDFPLRSLLLVKLHFTMTELYFYDFYAFEFAVFEARAKTAAWTITAASIPAIAKSDPSARQK
jgi:hypothetical protein